MKPPVELRVVDLFCGIGGLSYGLRKEGFKVVAGLDMDESCKFGYEHNNGAQFIHRDIRHFKATELKRLFGKKEGILRVLVGCAPCQPFSRLNPGAVTKEEEEPLERFASLIKETLPDIVSMENVAALADTSKHPIFKQFLDTLDANGYQYSYEIVNAAEYGVPQNRKRLVLLASRFGPIKLVDRTHKDCPNTVRSAISRLAPISDGEASELDRLHRASKLSETNLQRIKATPHDGGNSESWSDDLMLECYKRESGHSYKGTVYGRMRWDEPAPTMTTQCVGLGNGRFGHPEQDRAISLREAAILQTFPQNYKFVSPESPIVVRQVARFIGNAVPVRLGAVIGKSIKRHVSQYVRV